MDGFTLLDAVLAIVVVAATVRGLRAGFARQLLSVGFFLFGLVVGALLAPWAAGFVDAERAKALVALAVLMGSALMVGAAGEALGWRARAILRRLHLGGVDAALGAAFGTVGSLLLIWLAAAMLASAPLADIGRTIQGSRIIRSLSERLPASPGVIARIERFLDPLGFPRVFAGLEPDAGPPLALPGAETLRPTIDAAAGSTVKVTGVGCGGLLTGSGFVAAPGLVVTNAHVVAGTRDLRVQDREGTRAAVAVTFDPDTDLAVLRVDGLNAAPLPLATEVADRGLGGVTLGYPGGGPLTAGPAAVLRSVDAEGRDIYNLDLTRRSIYLLQADIRPGSSGGPFVLADGRVAGVVFARSVSDPGVAYALRVSELTDDLALAAATNVAVSTGPCAAD